VTSPFVVHGVELDPGNFTVPVGIPFLPAIIETFIEFSASSCSEFGLFSNLSGLSEVHDGKECHEKECEFHIKI
jgi:hypothetical protein